MDLLLDVNVIVDSCLGRRPWCEWSDAALEKCRHEGGRLWIYAGSVQTLEYVTRNELRKMAEEGRWGWSAKQVAWRARELLTAFTADKHWLSALAGEGPVFSAGDPEDEQLLRALDRFPQGSIKLLTRDHSLLRDHPDKTVSPQEPVRERCFPGNAGLWPA